MTEILYCLSSPAFPCRNKATIAELEAANARMREALTAIQGQCDKTWSPNFSGNTMKLLNNIWHIARKAKEASDENV